MALFHQSFCWLENGEPRRSKPPESTPESKPEAASAADLALKFVRIVDKETTFS